MKMFLSLQRAASLGFVFCLLCAARASAQSVSFQPLPLPPPQAAQGDRPASENDLFGAHRKDHLSIGVLAGIGFPRPLAVEGVMKIERLVLVGVEYSALPEVTVSQTSASASAVAGDVRVFPLRGPFFFGLRAGKQHIEAATTVSAYGYSVPASLSADTVFINPRLGLLWTWAPGISLGIDAGVQIPLSTSTASSLPSTSNAYAAQAEKSAQQSIESAAGLVGNAVLPTVDLLQLGMMF